MRPPMQRPTFLLVAAMIVAGLASALAFLPPSSRPPRLLPVAPRAVPRSTLGAGLSVTEALDMLLGLDSPSVADYNLALAACAREGNHEPGCWLIEEMAELGLTPDRTSYALAIESCAPDGMVEEARHLLECMKDAGASGVWVCR